MFHGAWAEILYGQGFEKNLQQISIRPTFFNSFPQIVHNSNATGVWSERQSFSVRETVKVPKALGPYLATG